MIAILPEYQGKGIGGCVMRQLIERANSQSKDVALSVFKINTAARRFYERFGFKVEGETPTHFNMRRKESELPTTHRSLPSLIAPETQCDRWRNRE